MNSFFGSTNLTPKGLSDNSYPDHTCSQLIELYKDTLRASNYTGADKIKKVLEMRGCLGLSDFTGGRRSKKKSRGRKSKGRGKSPRKSKGRKRMSRKNQKSRKSRKSRKSPNSNKLTRRRYLKIRV